jgi:hypothetical protein
VCAVARLGRVPKSCLAIWTKCEITACARKRMLGRKESLNSVTVIALRARNSYYVARCEHFTIHRVSISGVYCLVSTATCKWVLFTFFLQNLVKFGGSGRHFHQQTCWCANVWNKFVVWQCFVGQTSSRYPRVSLLQPSDATIHFRPLLCLMVVIK